MQEMLHFSIKKAVAVVKFDIFSSIKKTHLEEMENSPWKILLKDFDCAWYKFLFSMIKRLENQQNALYVRVSSIFQYLDSELTMKYITKKMKTGWR